VAYDAVDAGIARKAQNVIIDTAGRLHTKVNLMEELKKIQRVIKKRMPEAPHEVLLVLDATTGQNALQQARIFTEALNISGIVLTKLDGSAKGGIVIAIQKELNIPIKLIGVGKVLKIYNLSIQMRLLRLYSVNRYVSFYEFIQQQFYFSCRGNKKVPIL
jgi:fused signal recognition particle receptor